MTFKRRLRSAILPLTFLVSAPSAYAQVAINTPVLGLPVSNFRDIAGVATQFGGTGAAYSTSYGGTMRTGVFYRSNALGGMSAADQATVNKLGITLDLDLRTPSEVAADGDIVPAGAVYKNINVIGSSGVALKFSTPDQAVAFMQQVNSNFVSVDHERAAIASVLLDMAHNQGASLFHCTAGKDRTGWVAAVLDSIAGMSSTDIMSNYMATNAYSASLIQQELAQYQIKYNSYAAVLAPTLVVEQSYLQAGLDQVASQYGSMQNYLIQGLGLTQADIYVLRAKMVYYQNLPGEANLQGNAASGAALLRNLQNSPLSGNYTAFNYYLQSAIDNQTLSGEQNVVGGQVYADTASALTRAALQTNQSIASNISGVELKPGQGHVWMTALGSYFGNQGATGTANDVERFGASMIGVTYRPSQNAALNGGASYGTGTVSSAGAGNTLDTYSFTAGGRYALSSLERGAYAATQVSYEYATMRARRGLGNGLGTASGRSHAGVYSGQIELGDRFGVNNFTLSPEVGVYASHVNVDAFREFGSELALSQEQLKHTLTALTMDLPVQLQSTLYRGWALSPAVTVSYARVLGKPTVRSTGTIDGYVINQDSSFNNPNIFGANVGLTANRNAWSLQANAGTQFTTNGSTGFTGRLALNYHF